MAVQIGVISNFMSTFTEVCLELTAIQVMTLDTVDATDICALMVKEWPIAPCNTPMELYVGMVSTVLAKHNHMTTVSRKMNARI